MEPALPVQIPTEDVYFYFFVLLDLKAQIIDIAASSHHKWH